MKCDHCDKPAVVHEVVIKNGVKSEVHLCQAHAASAGYVPEPQPINQLIGGFAAAAASSRKTANAPTCTNCGMTLAQFRQHGNLGCEACYQTFEAMLEPLIERRTPAARITSAASRTASRIASTSANSA